MTKRYVVTGGNSGIGKGAVEALARDGHEVWIAARNLQLSTAVAKEIAEASKNPNIVPKKLDLGSLDSVRAFAEEVRAPASAALGGIICNAGLQFVSGTSKSADGFEATFAINHLGHFALTLLLLDHLRGARIVFLGSATHDPAEGGAKLFGFRGAQYTSARALAAGAGDESRGPRGLGLDRYATSKLANIICAYELGRRVPIDQAAFFAVDPGLVPSTALSRDYSPIARTLYRSMAPLLSLVPGVSTAARSGAALAWAATSRELDGRTGVHLRFDHQETRTSSASHDPAIALDLFDESAKLTGTQAILARYPRPTALPPSSETVTAL
jgi:protochlorophyllide reductase